MISIAITDDHAMIIEGLKAMFQLDKKYVISASYSSLKETLQNIARDKPNVLLLDINLKDGNGTSICKEVLKLVPNLKIIALTSFEDVNMVRLMLRNGAKGYLLKNTSSDEIITAINMVMNDEIYLPKELKNQILNESIGIEKRHDFLPKITRREKEVLALIVEEFTTDEIADKLFVTTKAIEAHRSNLIQKLNVRNTAGLVKIAIEKGLL
ncbi:response regulator transcription factor [Flavobacterium jejuense]|uniref:Response regulator transcription factor n=1 Tax=Flavobacterium jejuense TaxID=1544455 RepID=A0ABX0IRJ4_9FLAO|nr:response regulator transcription factor [Flavobacterium jejuense]NHN24504.1 response regulator transcription factor [Flavobacterium jejuense]